VLLTEALMAGLDGVPSTRAYVPGRVKLQSRWPIYLIFAVTAMVTFPSQEAALLRVRYGVLIYAVVLLQAAGWTRFLVERRLPPPGLTPEAAEELARFDLH
jgi:hypothetical protein